MLVLMLKVKLGTGHTATVRGRLAWLLKELMTAEATGCSAFDIKTLHWSNYVYKLRQLGFVIDTLREPHGGRFPGHHARYVLRGPIIIVEEGLSDTAKRLW